MLTVDSHCHVGDIWYEPAETLLSQMDKSRVERAVLIQILGQFDNGYQQRCVRQWPDRFVSVVAVDASSADAVTRLEDLAGAGATGVRLRPHAGSPGDDRLSIWRAAADLGLAVSCVGTTSQFTSAAFLEVVLAVPQLPIVLEHLGGVARPDADDSAIRVWDLAQHPNVFLKVPGLGQLSKRLALLPSHGSPFEPGGEGPLKIALETFTAGRLLWGSDFPVVSTREGYDQALKGPRAILCDAGEAELQEIFGGVAGKVFRVPE